MKFTSEQIILANEQLIELSIARERCIQLLIKLDAGYDVTDILPTELYRELQMSSRQVRLTLVRAQAEYDMHLSILRDITAAKDRFEPTSKQASMLRSLAREQTEIMECADKVVSNFGKRSSDKMIDPFTSRRYLDSMRQMGSQALALRNLYLAALA